MRLTRRQTIRSLAAAGVGLGLRGHAESEGAPQGRKPNILFVMADDLGYADLSCYGRTEYRTPVLDRLAQQGIRFTQAYANSAVCTATRVALITGRYQYRLPVGLEEPLASPARHIGLPPGHPTLPSLLKQAGYGTALVGKWHMGWLPDFSPLKSGYDHFYGFRAGAVDYFTHGYRTGPDLWDGDVPVEEHGYLTDLLATKAIGLIGDYAEARQSFFLSLHFNAPHWPWEGPDDEAESKRIAGKLGDYDGGDLATYARMVVAMDSAIGRVLQTLDRHGIADNTIVVFTSDNGGERFSKMWPFSGSKMELLEGGLRIPAMALWPGRIAPGTTTDQVAISMDWVATLLAAAGAKPADQYPLDGMNLLPWLTGNGTPMARTLYWRYHANGQRAVRDGDLKWLQIRSNDFLFDVSRDPLERANLKARRPDDYQRLVALWKAWDATMLPIDPRAYTESIPGNLRADHYGVEDD